MVAFADLIPDIQTIKKCECSDFGYLGVIQNLNHLATRQTPSI